MIVNDEMLTHHLDQALASPYGLRIRTEQGRLYQQRCYAKRRELVEAGHEQYSKLALRLVKSGVLILHRADKDNSGEE